MKLIAGQPFYDKKEVRAILVRAHNDRAIIEAEILRISDSAASIRWWQFRAMAKFVRELTKLRAERAVRA